MNYKDNKDINNKICKCMYKINIMKEMCKQFELGIHFKNVNIIKDIYNFIPAYDSIPQNSQNTIGVYDQDLFTKNTYNRRINCLRNWLQIIENTPLPENKKVSFNRVLNEDLNCYMMQCPLCERIDSYSEELHTYKIDSKKEKQQKQEQGILKFR